MLKLTGIYGEPIWIAAPHITMAQEEKITSPSWSAGKPVDQVIVTRIQISSDSEGYLIQETPEQVASLVLLMLQRIWG